MDPYDWLPPTPTALGSIELTERCAGVSGMRSLASLTSSLTAPRFTRPHFSISTCLTPAKWNIGFPADVAWKRSRLSTGFTRYTRISDCHLCSSITFTKSAILNSRCPIMDSLTSSCKTSYRSSIETMVLNCFVLRKLRFCVRILATDEQRNGETDQQTDSSNT